MLISLGRLGFNTQISLAQQTDEKQLTDAVRENRGKGRRKKRTSVIYSCGLNKARLEVNLFTTLHPFLDLILSLTWSSFRTGVCTALTHLHFNQ